MNRIFTRNLLKLHQLTSTCKRYTDCPSKEISEPDDAEVGVTTNGIRVITEQTQSPLACVSLFILTGSRYENTAYNGINHFIEHMAFKGSTNMYKSCVEHFVSTSGSRLDAHTSQEYQRFSVTCLPQYAQQAVALLCGIVCELTLDPCEIEREKERICYELQDDERDYKKIVLENLIQTAFQGTSLGQKVIGPSTNITRFDNCMAEAYMTSHYQPWRLVFASSGPVQNSSIMCQVSNMLCNMHTTCETDYRGDTRFTSSSVIYRDDSKEFAHVAVAVEAPGFLSEHYIALRVMKNLIGCWNKYCNIYGAWPELAMRCADTELCQRFEGFYIPFSDVGLWGVYYASGRMETEDFIHNWAEILKEMCISLRASDLERAKVVTKKELFKERLGSFNSSVFLGMEMIYRNKPPSMQGYLRAVDILKPLDIQAIAYNLLYNAHMVVSAAGPTECLPEYNRLAAGQYWLRW